MKNVLLTIAFAFFASLSIAQNHMTFKGIPIDGTLNSFVQKLKAKGYTYVTTQDGMALLTGEFAATKGCTIVVSRFSDRDQVNLVGVIFPEEKTWSKISSTYFTLKRLLTEKYGEPDSIEFFSDDEPCDDFLKFHALLGDECHYTSEFSEDNGKIQLTMAKQSYNSASVILKYIDDANAKETRKKIMDDL